MVSVDREKLIAQICGASGAQGKNLEAMRKRLSLMNEPELMFVLRGIYKGENLGLEVEKTGAPPPAPNADNARQKLTDEQAKDFSIQTIIANIKAAEKIVESQDLGIVSKGYDSLKQHNAIGNHDISTGNVKEVIANQKAGVQSLKYAKDGALSKRDYYLQNKERLKQMILRRLYTIDSKSGDNFIDRNKGGYTKEEFAEFLENYINSAVNKIQSLDSIKGMQHSLVMADEAKEAEFLGKLLQNANKERNKPNLNGIEGQGVKLKSDNIPPEFNTDEAIKFEEVYKYERGTEYSKETVERYKKASDEMNFVTGAFNSLQKYSLSADKLLTDYKEAKKVHTDSEGNPHGGDEPQASTRKTQFLEFFNSYYSLKDDKGKTDLKKLINQSKLPIQLIEKEDGSYDIDLSAYSSDAQKNRALNSLLQLGKQNQKELFEKLLGGKSLESYQADYEQNFAAAMGSDNAEELSQTMKEDNMSAIQRYAGNTAMAGMGLMVAGGILTAVPVTSPLGLTLMGIGQVGALGGMAARNALGFNDAFTRDNLSTDELKELSKNLAMDVGGFLIGGAAGKKGLQYGAKIIANSGDKVAGFIAEKGTDFTLSLAGDLAMMGILNTADTSEGLTQGNLMGIAVSTITGISSAKYSHMKSKAHKPEIHPETPKADIPEIKPANETSPDKPTFEEETVAPFAQRALDEPQIGDVVIPDKSKIDIENGDFDKDGNFVSDGTFTRTSKQPLAKSKTFKPAHWGNLEVAETYKDLGRQIFQSTKLSQNEVKNQIYMIKGLINENPDLKISDVSEILIDMQILNKDGITNFLDNWKGLANVKNFGNFKDNLTYLAKTANELRINEHDAYYIDSKLTDINMKYLTEDMANIKPEEFKKNLDYYKTLDSKLQDGVTQYDYDILFKVHEDKYFERLDAAKDYNKYLTEQGHSNYNISYNAHLIGEYTDEGFAVFKDNINLVKDLYEKKIINPQEMTHIVYTNDASYKIAYDKFTELPPEKISSVLWHTMTERFAGNTRAQNTTVEMLKHMDNDMVKELMANDNNYTFFNHIGSLDEAGSKNLILKSQILEKMPQMIKHNNKAEYYNLKHFLSEYKIEKPEKVLEFINLAEPAYLARIQSGEFKSVPYDFNTIFNQGNLDVMIENAKLHQKLPQEFREYLNSDQSLAKQNFQNSDARHIYDYNSNPDEFAQRVETVNKYNGKLHERILEYIYNGSLKSEDKILNLLSSINQEFSINLVYRDKIDFLNKTDDETLKKFAKVFKETENISSDESRNTVDEINDNFMNMLKNMTNEEIDALPFNALVNMGQYSEEAITEIKNNIHLIPERIRKIIKEDSNEIYKSWHENAEKKKYLQLIKNLDKMSDEDLQNIGSPALVMYLQNTSNPKDFNPESLEAWKNVPVEIKEKLGSFAYTLLTDEKVPDMDLIKQKAKLLKDHDVFNAISKGRFKDLIDMSTKETDAVINKIISHPGFDKTQADFMILIMLKKRTNLDFVNKLINHPNMKDINEVTNITSQLSNVKEVSAEQQKFALELLNRDDVDNSIISGLLAHISETEYNSKNGGISSPLNKIKQDFARELLDHPNIKNEDIQFVLTLLSNKDTYETNMDLVRDIVNSQKVSIRKINNNGGFKKDMNTLTKFMVNQEALNEGEIYDILRSASFHFPEVLEKIKPLLQELIADKSYGDADLSSFIGALTTNKETPLIQIPFIKELCHIKDFPKKEIGGIVKSVNEQNINLVRDLCYDKDISNKQVRKITDYLSKNKNNIDNIKPLLETSGLKQWTNQNLENGLDVETIIGLVRTQKKLFIESETAKIKKETAASASKPEPKAVEEAKPAEIAKAEEILVNLGVHPKMAPNYVKMCRQNDVVDKVKLEAVCALAQSGVPVNEIKNIFNLATGNALSSMNGEFRPDIIKDIVTYKQSGIDDIKFAANLAAAKNMSLIELKGRINTKVREDLINRINELPDDIKENLKSKGTDIEAIVEKAKAEPKAGKVKQADVAQIRLRSLDSIVGVEKLILNKYKNEIDQNIWGDPERFKVWAEEKLKKVIDFNENPDYTAKGDYSKFNDARKEGVESWYKYLKEESNYKDDVFVQLFVMEGITKDMKPNNANTPPAVSHESFEATYNALLENSTSVSFSKIYAQQAKLKAIKEFTKQDVSMDGIEGKWVTIPQSKKGEPDYDEHVAMVQALSEGSSWCLRFENAHTYLAKGNLHFFIDKNGNSQVAIHETDRVMKQIQKRYDQDSTVPIPYVNVIDAWAKENNYTGLETHRQAALDAKPEFDKLKNKLAELEAKGDYSSMFKELNIDVRTATDGTYILSTYNPRLTKQYSLFDLGVNENKLMQNVSQINSKLNLDGSSLTAMPNLKVIRGLLTFGDNKISDLRNLEKINGKDVTWDK